MSTLKPLSLESLVSEGNTKEAISLLRTLINNLHEGPLKTLLLLENRFSTIKNDEQKNIISRDVSSLEMNRINNSFLHVLTDIKELVQEHINIYKPIPRKEEDSDALGAFIYTNLQLKFQNLERFSTGTDFIHFKAKTVHSDMDVMIRVIKSSDSLNFENNDYLKRIVKLKHRNLVQLLETNFHTYPYYIITEFISGISLKDLLTDLGPLPLHNVKRLLSTIGDVMITLRKKKLPLAGLRPSKIFIDSELEIEISPFSLFIASDKKRLFKTFKEECLYFSPETLYHLASKRTSDEIDKSNQFCLATLGFEMLTGNRLFSGETVEDILLNRKHFFTDKAYRKQQLSHPRLTNRMSKILDKMLRFSPEKRYDNMSMALRQISRVRADFDADELQAFNSYRRCLEYTDNFVDLFYENLFSNAYMQNIELGAQQKKELRAKFYRDLHLLFDVENALCSLRKMVTLEQGEDNPLAEYILFLDVFIETIHQCDPRCKLNSPISNAWLSIKHRIYEGLNLEEKDNPEEE